MIEDLVIGIPRDTIKRESSDSLSKFEKLTGVLKTRHFKDITISEAIFRTLLFYNHNKEIDNVIVVTQTPDRLSPCLALNIVKQLGLASSTLAFDVNHACDGWVIGVHLANRLGGRTLLVCADMLRYKPGGVEDLIFSDAVSITRINATHNNFIPFNDTSGIESLYMGIDGKMRMDGNAVFDFATVHIPYLVSMFKGYDYLVLHQANHSMNKIIAKRSGAEDISLSSIEEFGNQSMNSIPACLLFNEDKILNKKVLCVGFGAGFTAAGMTIEWPKDKITRLIHV